MQDLRGRRLRRRSRATRAHARGAAAFVALLTAGFVSLLLASSRAEAIPYFNAPYGFDNSTLQLSPDYDIPTDADFGFVASGVTAAAVGLQSADVINDTPTGIDRTITWTIINNTLPDVSEFVLILTGLVPSGFDYSGANIDVDIAGSDPMVIASYGPYFFAGYHFTRDDFTLVAGDLVATRTFRYTVDVPEAASGPPDLGIAYTATINVPEPATGLLLAGAMLLAAGAGRRRAA